MTSFDEVVFPLELVYGSAGGPGYQTGYVALASGATERVSQAADPLHVYDARQAVRTAADMAVLKDFYLARRGGLRGFLLKDPADFSTGPEGRGAPSPQDVLLGYGDGTRTKWQMVKRYNPGTDWEYVRPIKKPKAGSLLASVDGIPTTALSFSTSTGEVVFVVPPPVGATVRAGCLFYTPVFFGREADRLLRVEMAAFNDHRLSIPMIEDRADYPQQGGRLYGHASWATSPAADVLVSSTEAYLWGISGSPANGAGWRLPDASGMQLGGPHFLLANQTGQAIGVRDATGLLLTQVPALTSFNAYLFQAPTSAGKSWLLAR